jgi:hypothetical protein
MTDQVLAAARARRTSTQAARDYVALLTAYIDSFHHTLVMHEWCHVLQALVYPGLFFRCVREFQFVNGILSALRHDLSQSVPARFVLPEAVQYVWTSQLQPFRIEITDIGENRSGPAPEGDQPRPNNLTENDLLEDDACVFQYKAEIAGPGTGAGYARWLRERRRYTMTFKLLERMLGEESAFIALPALVRAAFSTTQPMSVFAALLAFLVRDRTLPEDVGSDMTMTLIMNLLLDCNLKAGRPDPSRSPYDEELLYIDPHSHAEFVAYSVLHPLWPLARRLWPGKGDGGRELKARFLRLPHEKLNRRSGATDPDMMIYWPPATVVRLVHPDVSIRDSVLLFSEQYAGVDCAFMPGVKYPAYRTEVIARRSLAMSMATDFYRSAAHNCHHSGCQFFPVELCKRWLKVPEDPGDCEFPGFVQDVTTRRLNPDSTLVRPEGAAQ